MKASPLRPIRESFGTRIFVAFGSLLMLIILAFGGFYLKSQRTYFRETLVREGTNLARNLAYNARIGTFSENAGLLKTPLAGIAQSEGVLSAAVFTREGRMLREDFGGARSRPSVPPPSEEVLRALELSPAPLRFEHEAVMEFWAPIILEAGNFSEEDLYFGKSPADLGERTIGFARVIVDKEISGQKFWALVLNSVLLLGVFLLVSGVVTLIIVRKITQPLDRLTEGVRSVEEGEFARVPVETVDEVGRVAVAFNHMVNALEKRESERNRAEAEIRSLNADLEYRVRARTAELEEANRELESFNYSVSHDLRAPLVRIEGFCQAFLEEYDSTLDTTGRFYLERTQVTCRQMGEIIRGMMSLSQVSRGELRREQINLSAMAERAVEALREMDPERRIRAVVAPDILGWGDPGLISILLENLLGNAWKFSAGRDDALIEFGARIDSGNQRCYIRDNGVGFDAKYADRLFRPFERLHAPGQFPGTGIGLAIVRKVIERHGGHIALESRAGEGTTVWFSLTSAGEGA